MTHPLLNVMSRAASLAVRHRPHPNPAVGAVVVSDDGRVLGEGAHRGAGLPHAEIEALNDVGDDTTGATMVVTLEPCSHQGRTPPCVDAIVDAGISRVVIGGLDPDSRVSGGGVERLRAAGIDVVEGVEGFEYEAVDPAYFHHRRTGMPLVTLKAAATLDGQVAAADGTSQWITGEEARNDGHRLRSDNDVIMIGAGTLIIDDPRLTARSTGSEQQPLPVVVAGKRELPTQARLWKRSHLVVSTAEMPGHETLVVPRDDNGADRPDPAAMMNSLADRGHLSVLVEGGPNLASSLLHAKVIDRIIFYLAPSVAGGSGMGMFAGVFPTLTAMTPVTIESVTMVGTDIRVIARPKD